MGIGEYWCAGPGAETIQLGRKSCSSDHQPRSSSSSSGTMRKARWKLVWMNLLMKEKSSAFQYDEFSYALNFDQGDSAAAEAAMDEPEYFRRSFSVRYADPSSRLNNISSSRNKPPLL